MDRGIRPGRKKRDPQCARCKIHGEKNSVKGHKNLCEFKFCDCGKCNAVADRQQKMALQIRDRRQRKADEKMREELRLDYSHHLGAATETVGIPTLRLFSRGGRRPSDLVDGTDAVSTRSSSGDELAPVSRKELEFIRNKVQTYNLDYSRMAPVLLAILRQLKSEDEAEREIVASVAELPILRQEAHEIGLPFDAEETLLTPIVRPSPIRMSPNSISQLFMSHPVTS